MNQRLNTMNIMLKWVPHMAMTITGITDDDIKEIIALWNRCSLTRPWNDPFADIALARRGEHSTVLVGRENGMVVASAMVGHDGHRGWVYYVAVEPSMQNEGRGRAIMSAAEAWLKARKVPKLQLMIRIDNSQARDFYEAIGFSLQDTILYGKWINDRK
ncbi:MAG TPA: GNAT family acetyltransferase [Methanocella sp.]|nr:GNAT family acetyltransferase [Methanocella sp.]